MILEQTDLISPDRGEYHWTPLVGFFMGRISCNHPLRGSWHAPWPFFLVNRCFFAIAIEIFWKSNHFVVHCPDKEVVTGLGDALLQKRYGASQFFTNAVPKTALPHLRSLKFQNLTATCGEEDDLYTEEWAAKDWFRTLERARARGLANLDIVYVQYGTFWDDGIDDDGFSCRSMYDGEIAEMFRALVRQEFWPFEDQNLPVGIRNGLVAMLRLPNGRDFHYFIRKKDDNRPLKHACFESPAVCLYSKSISEYTQMVGRQTWIEQVWETT